MVRTLDCGSGNFGSSPNGRPKIQEHCLMECHIIDGEMIPYIFFQERKSNNVSRTDGQANCLMILSRSLGMKPTTLSENEFYRCVMNGWFVPAIDQLSDILKYNIIGDDGFRYISSSRLNGYGSIYLNKTKDQKIEQGCLVPFLNIQKYKMLMIRET